MDVLIRQGAAQIGKVARHDRLNVSGEDGRVRALILAPLARYFMACRDRNAWQQRAQSFCGSHLVRWIDVGMQDDDSDRFDASRRNRIRDGLDRGHGKRDTHAASCVNTLDDLEAQMSRHERFGWRGMEDCRGQDDCRGR